MTERDPDRAAPQTAPESSTLDLDPPPVDPVPATAPLVSTRPTRLPTPWRRYLVLAVVGVVLVVVAAVLMTSLLPRWWAGTVGRQANATFSGGIGWGVFYGFVFTFVPLLIASLAFVRRWKAVVSRLIFIVIGVLLATPNLITLGIVIGTNNAAHAGERIFDVQAPGFRWATFLAAILAVVLAALVWVLSAVRRRAVAELKRLRAEHGVRDEDDQADSRAARRAARAEDKAARDRVRGQR